MPRKQPVFRVIAADPPWHNDDQLPGAKRGASKHYPTMSTEAIAMMPYKDTATFPFPRIADTALLFLWRLSSMVDDALHVVKSWGFTAKSEVVWAKYHPCKFCRGAGWIGKVNCIVCHTTGCGTPWFGMGRYTRAQHETCIIAARGKMASEIRAHNIRSVFHAPVPADPQGGARGRHSAKPDRFYTDIVMQLAAGPYVELFARKLRAGWTVLGNQAKGT